MSTILDTIRYLSIFTGAVSLFFLGHAWFEFGLADVIHRLHEWYAGLVHPVVELLKPVALWITGLFGWSLPRWWHDFVVLYLAMGGATARGNDYLLGIHRNLGKGWRNYQPPGPDPDGSLRRKHASWAEVHERQAEIAARYHLLATPLRMAFWPIFWAIDAISMLSRTRTDVTLRHGYVVSSAVEFFKILLGALIFAGLNAGLG